MPKVLDIKSQVINTADTVRQLRNDVIEVKDKFDKAVSGIEEATNDIKEDDLAVLNDIRSFRMSFGDASSLVTEKALPVDEVTEYDRNYALALRASLEDSDGRGKEVECNLEESDPNISQTRTGAIPRIKTVSKSNKKKKTRQNNKENHNTVDISLCSESDTSINLKEGYEKENRYSGDGAWKLVGGRRSNPISKYTGPRSYNNYRVMGSRKSEQSSMKAVKRTADVFLGRVEKSMKVEEIVQYIKDNFEIEVENIEALKIRTDKFNAFKITVLSTDRERLFNSELWPEGMVVNKYYNRKV